MPENVLEDKQDTKSNMLENKYIFASLYAPILQNHSWSKQRLVSLKNVQWKITAFDEYYTEEDMGRRVYMVKGDFQSILCTLESLLKFLTWKIFIIFKL